MLSKDYTILDNLLESCQIISCDWVYLYINDSAASQNCQKKEDIIGRIVMDIYPNIIQTKLFDLYEKCMSDRIPVTVEHESIFSDDRATWYETRIQPVPEGIFIMSLDISERKKEENNRQIIINKEKQLTKELQVSNRKNRIKTDRLQLLKDNLLIEIKQRDKTVNYNLEQLREKEILLSEIINLSSEIIYAKDINSRWIYVNPALEKILDKKSEYLLGKTDLEIYSTSIGDTILKNDRRIMDYGMEETLEEVIETKGGNRSFISVKTPRFNDKNQVIGMVGISHDITESKIAEKALEKSEKNYKDLVDNSLVGIFKTNLKGEILFANKAIADIFQYDTVEQFSKENIKNIYKNRYDRHSLIKKLQTHHQISDYELECCNKNGELVDVILSANLKDDIISGMFMDITIIKKAERYRNNKDKRFKTLIKNSTDLIRILDNNGKIIFDSPSSNRILGYPEGSLIGRSPLEFVHPEDVEIVKAELDDVYKNKNSDIPTEFRILKADGSYIAVESITQNMMQVPDIEGIVVTTHPIQRRKEMEDAIKESEKKYKTLFKEDPDYTILIGTDGKILDVSTATTKLAGLSRNELIGKYFVDLKIIPPEDIEIHLDKINRLLKDEYIKPFEARLIDKEGNIRNTIIHVIAVKEKGKISYILGIATDVTEQKLAEKELRLSLKEKNTLIQEIHHRVKNNMQIISSLLNLQIQYVDDEEAIDVLMESQNRVRSMSIIHEKLYCSENLTHINFFDYIQSLVSNLFYSFNVKNNQIKANLEIEKVSLNIETAAPCGLIINEIVSNSLKYAFPNKMLGEIFISLKSLGDEYELIIQDNGIGLPDNLEFDNLESLGLLLISKLTEQIDGKLTMKIRDPTEFKIIFKELEYKNRI